VTSHILVVDDVEKNARLLADVLAAKGYRTSKALSGAAALEAIGAEPPDLVLLDVNLPRRSGYEVCEAVRANPEWSAVRVVMLTARGRDIERQKGLALGAHDYVTKPFSTREVVDKVRAILGETGDT
jgi:DNA-binding response OmpR family regulator